MRNWIGVSVFLAVLKVILGILGAIALFAFIFGRCIMDYSYQMATLICYYALVALAIFLPVYLIILLLKTRSLGKEYLKLLYIIKHLAISFTVGWLVCCAMIYIMQDNLYFITQKTSSYTISSLKSEYKNAEEVKLNTADDVMLHGFLFKPNTRKKSPLIIFFNGSGGDVLSFAYIANEFSKRGYFSALINYRGFGLSQGKPSEKNFYKDAQFIYDYFCKRSDVDNKNVYAIGGSMGAGVTLNLAANRPLKALVLFSPYDKIAGGTIHDTLPFLPTSILFKNKFNAISFSHQVKIPVLCLIAENDKIIRPERSLKLSENLGGKFSTKIISKANHLSIYSTLDSWEYIYEFLGRENVQ